MRLSIAALAFSLLAAGAASVVADPSTSTSYQVQNPHGGYNVIQGGAPHQGLAFFGAGGFASHAIAHAHDKPNFILRPTLEDDGHGKKIVVYKKIYYATPEEAEAAKANQ
jgi:opacity protein-like surface antigen